MLITSGCIMPWQETSISKAPFEGCSEDDDVIENETCTIQIDIDKSSEGDDNSNSTISIGTSEGEMIPNFLAKIHQYNSISWDEFEFYSMFNETWDGISYSNSTEESKWVFVIFISSDCGHCWNAGDDISNLYENYSNQSNFFAFAVNFSSNDNFNASQEEVVAFQEKGNNSGCIGNSRNCQDRPGLPHYFPYIDDRNQSIMRYWSVSGTPAYFIIKPNGIVAWNQYQHSGEGGDGENVSDALQRLLN